MNAFEEELKQKTDQELLEMAATPNKWNDDFFEAINNELQGRGVSVEPKEHAPLVEHKLNLAQRRKICESCKNHSNEIPTNPDSPAICGLTMKDPDFIEALCEKYDPIPGYKKYLLRMSLLSLVMGILCGAWGITSLINELPKAIIRPRSFILSILCIAGIVYSIIMFVKMLRFKYPNQPE